ASVSVLVISSMFLVVSVNCEIVSDTRISLRSWPQPTIEDTSNVPKSSSTKSLFITSLPESNLLAAAPGPGGRSRFAIVCGPRRLGRERGWAKYTKRGKRGRRQLTCSKHPFGRWHPRHAGVILDCLAQGPRGRLEDALDNVVRVPPVMAEHV